MAEKPATEKPKRHLFQIRKTEDSGARQPYYAPNRDWAHNGPGVIRGAMISLEEKYWEPWIVDYMRANNITYQDILDTKAPLLFAKALGRIMQADNPVVALTEEGFTELPHPIQMLIYTRIGQVALCGIWSGIKDISAEDSAPPLTLQHFLDEVNDAFGEFIADEDDSEDT